MLTRDILFGMNILTLGGLLKTGFGLTLRRMGHAGVPLCLSVICVGTVLVLAGHQLAPDRLDAICRSLR